MGIGYLLLVANKSEENLFMNGSPEITFFKKTFKRHTNFSIENSIQEFNTPDPDFGRKLTVNISKQADMIGKIYLNVVLPSIQEPFNSLLPSNIKKFAWIKKIGLGLIKNIDLEINGIHMSRITGDYLNIIYNLTNDKSKQQIYNELIGNIEELYDYSTNKQSYSLMIPLDFWFCSDSELYLPVVALKHADIKIHVEFNSFNKCFKETPTHYITVDNNFCLFEDNEIIRQTVNNETIIGEFVYYETTTKRLYYNKIYGDFKVPPNDTLTDTYKIIGDDSQFSVLLTTSSQVISDNSYFNTYPHMEDAKLYVDYIYLDTFERFKFQQDEIRYLIPLVYNLQEKKCTSVNDFYSLDTLANPTKMILWRAQMMYNYTSNNIFDYTTYPYDTNPKSTIKTNQIIINSQPREDLKFEKFYSNIQFYKYGYYNKDLGIYMYNFSLFPKEYQPSGSMNFSMAENTSQIKIQFNNIVSSSNPIIVKGYSIYYTIFNIIDGIGNVEFYS